MPDFRITTGRTRQAQRECATLVEALIHRADDVARRYWAIAAGLPYRSLEVRVLDEDIAALSKELAAATWQRVGDEVPTYAFAERVGRRYRDSGATVGALLLHWHIFRRAVHLVLADEHLKTGQGSEDQLRQGTLMNYALDWATEASLVGFVIAPGSGTEIRDTAG
ncbi:MAG: hypothetical protein ACE5K7_08140 [Phycisphaerae bacterium]